MCGLVGVAGRFLGKNEITFMEQALYSDALRGMHSTGIASVYRQNMKSEWKGEVIKRANNPLQLFNLRAYDDFLATLNRNMFSTLMGHNRYATLGRITDVNAHPFVDNHIILAHNGTLRSWNHLPDSQYFTVDSECIAHSMAKVGVEETVGMLHGAFALSWIDLKEGTLNLIRNHERPLSIFLNDTMTKVVWGSEGKMMDWLIDRNKLNTDQEYLIEPGHWHVFDLNAENFHGYKVYEVELNKHKPIIYMKPKKEEKTKSSNSGNFPHSKGAQERINICTLELAKHGLEYHEEVLITAQEFVPYDATNPKSRGKLEGYMDDDPWLPVTVHGVYLDQIEINDPYLTQAVRVNLEDGYETLMGNTITHVPDIQEHLKKIEEQKEEDKKMEEEEIEQQLLLEEDGNKRIYKDPHGQDSTKEEIDFFTRFGCCSCQGDISVDDYSTLKWMVNGLPMCTECYDVWGNDDIDTTGRGH